jgi:hypothetical protein
VEAIVKDFEARLRAKDEEIARLARKVARQKPIIKEAV